MSRLFLCLGAAFLTAAAVAALFGFGVASDEEPPAARLGSLIALGLAAVSLGAGLFLRRWERAIRDLPGRRAGARVRLTGAGAPPAPERGDPESAPFADRPDAARAGVIRRSEP